MNSSVKARFNSQANSSLSIFRLNGHFISFELCSRWYTHHPRFNCARSQPIARRVHVSVSFRNVQRCKCALHHSCTHSRFVCISAKQKFHPRHNYMAFLLAKKRKQLELTDCHPKKLYNSMKNQ